MLKPFVEMIKESLILKFLYTTTLLIALYYLTIYYDIVILFWILLAVYIINQLILTSELKECKKSNEELIEKLNQSKKELILNIIYYGLIRGNFKKSSLLQQCFIQEHMASSDYIRLIYKYNNEEYSLYVEISDNNIADVTLTKWRTNDKLFTFKFSVSKYHANERLLEEINDNIKEYFKIKDGDIDVYIDINNLEQI